MLGRLLGRDRGEPRSVPMVLYTRRPCPLCDVMKARVARARLDGAGALVEVDVDRDPRLAERFGERVPVLEVGGEVAAEGRASAEEIERAFARLAAAWRVREGR